MQKLDERIEAAHDVLHELMATPDKGIPDDIAAKATCVAVVPGFKKGAFIVGGAVRSGRRHLPHRPRLERTRLHPAHRRQLRPPGRRPVH